MTLSTGQSTGADLIAAERERQVAEENWTPEHDDGHTKGELAMAAACYAAPTRIYIERGLLNGHGFADPWPFPPIASLSGRYAGDWDKRKSGNVVKDMPTEGEDRIRFLVKAGALIAAEIDRLQRKGAH